MNKGKQKLIFLEDLTAIKDSNKELITNIEKEESDERIETVEAIQNDIKGIRQNTEMKKHNFIIELQCGLGEKVKKNPTTIKNLKIEKKWYQKIGTSIKKIFTKF